MTDIETTVENARAQYHYPPIRSAILPSDADDLQMRLADRLHRHPHQHALEVIADLGRVFDAEDAEPAIEALGRLLVHTSLLAGCERMAIAPIILLGRELTRDSQVSNELPLRPAAMLAHAALDHRQEPAAIVRGLAMAIAKAIDDCEIVHELKIDPLELFKIAALEVLERKPVKAVTAPAVQPTQPDKAAQRALAWTELRKASEAVVADEIEQVPDGEPVELRRRDQAAPAGGGPLGDCVMASEAVGQAKVLRVPGPDDPGFRPFDDAAFVRCMDDAFAGVGPIRKSRVVVGEDGMTIAEPEPFGIVDEVHTLRDIAHRMDAVTPTCPTCHAPMSPRPDMPWAWSCRDHP